MAALGLLLLGLLGTGAEQITWHAHVQPLVASHCAGCHHAGGPAPFALIEYDDVARRRSFVLELLRSGRMPPWLPDDSGPALRDENRLSAAQIETLASWVEQGAPRGALGAHTARELDPARDEPELVASMPEPFELPREGPRDMHTFVLPVGNTERLLVRSVGWTSQVPRDVHTVTFLADGTGTARDLDLLVDGPGYDSMGDVGVTPSGSFGAIGPGTSRFELPAGYAFELPPDAHVVAEVHSLPTGRGGSLQGSVELRLSDVDEPALVLPLSLLDFEIDVAAGASAHALHDAWSLPCAVELLGILPRAGDVCRTIEVFAAAEPNAEANAQGAEAAARDSKPASAQILLRIPEWDPHFRRPYLFERPVVLEQGSVVAARWTLDNTADNLANPSSPVRPVTLGPSARDELVGVVLWVSPVDRADAPLLERFLLESVRARIARRGLPRPPLPALRTSDPDSDSVAEPEPNGSEVQTDH